MPSSTATAPSVWVTLPPVSLFGLPPSPQPYVLPPPPADFSFSRPFQISTETYNALLDVKIPMTVAAVYAATAYVLNGLNRNRKNRAWPVSRTRAFFAFVVAHNLLLAAYSAWTFAGMLNAISHTLPAWGSEGLAGIVDGLCKLSGPRGLGNGVTFDPASSAWGARNQAVRVLEGTPDGADLGRLWNEGLAFYGWLFYLSKFYEVLDTLIILAKGKKTSLLQTYHHAGAMLCMWAGIRYMSPPIWMFVLVNSGIHALMYSYYTLSAIGVRVPTTFKKALTTMQIVQLVFGATYALAHLFIAYDIPVQNPYRFAHNLSTAIPSLTSLMPSVTASAGVGGWLKKLMLRAAGEEGLAENVRNEDGDTFGLDAIKAGNVGKAQEEIRYRWEYSSVHCLDTSGQAFAIYLNVLYLAPLTWLFVTFFIRSYLGHTGSDTKHPTHSTSMAIRKSSFDAAKGVEREIHEAMSVAQGGYSDHEFAVDAGPPDAAAADELPSASKLASAAKKHAKKAGTVVSEKVSQATRTTVSVSKDIHNSAALNLQDADAQARDLIRKAYEAAEGAKSKAAASAPFASGAGGSGGAGDGDTAGKADEAASLASTEEGGEEDGKEGGKGESEGAGGGGGEEMSGSQEPVLVEGDPTAYEANIEQAMSGKDKKAQREMQ